MDRRCGLEVVGGGPVAEAEVVARDVVAAVARLREVGIAAAGCAADELGVRDGRSDGEENRDRGARERGARPADLHQRALAGSPWRRLSSSATVRTSSSVKGPGRRS